jgi:N-acetylmuramoyl-L-alanine amidase-like protein/penicillin-insensitive murein endopeptidase
MAKKPALGAITILQEFIPVGKKNRPGTKIGPSSITIHNTDNSNAGAGAKAHSSFVRNTGYYILNGQKHWVSWHFTVDDTYAIQHLPLDEVAYHAGSNANASSIAIEICMNSDNDQDAANKRAAALTAHLLDQLGLDTSDIKKHKDWTGKNCPSQLLTASKWNAFIELVKDARASAKDSQPAAGIDAGQLALSDKAGTAAEFVANYDLDHQRLQAALTSNVATDSDSEISTVLRQLVDSLSEDGGAQSGQSRLFFPHGITEIELSLSPAVSVKIKGPDKSSAAGADEEEEAEAIDSVPDDFDGAAKTADALAAAPPVNVKLPAPTETLYGTHTAERLYGIQRTIDAIQAVAKAFHDETGLRVGIGDISKNGGGPISGHASHQKGVDVDVRLPRNDGKEQATKYQNASYSRQRTQRLVDLFRGNRVFPVKVIFFNDPAVTGVSPWPNHDNHLHVRFDLAAI